MATKKKEKMNLREFFESEGVKQKFFANKANVSEKTISVAVKGKDINLSTAKKIVEASDGMISYESLASSINLD